MHCYFKDLPAKGQQEIKGKYKDYGIGSVIYFDDNEKIDSDMVLWATQFNDEDLYFAELTKANKKIIVRLILLETLNCLKSCKI